MRNKIIVLILIIILGAAGLFAVRFLSPVQQHEPSDVTFMDEPEARALYNKMIETIRKAETLSYESNYIEEMDGQQLNPCTYRVWMKKPKFFFLETMIEGDKKHGILIGDGQYAWSYWPDGRPWFSGEDNDAYKKSRFNVYMKEPAPPGKYSIGYAKVIVKTCSPILNPSIFQGIKDTLEPVIDWMRNLGVEKVGDENCNVIEVSYMNHQRSQYFWISRRDNLPRKIKEVVRTNKDIIFKEVWSKVTPNAEIPMEKFTWKPPKGWQQWHPPRLEDKLLKPRLEAPDFDLCSIDGGKIKLSDYRGKVVWLTFWRVGCPPCREEIPYLEELYSKYNKKGLVVLGFNFADDKKIALDFLRQYSVTFPNILDSSDEATKTGFVIYTASAAPVNYIIDSEGKIAAVWLGYDKNDKHGIEVLERLGIK